MLAAIAQMRAFEHRATARPFRTNSRNAMRLDWVDAVHRHDVGAGEVLTGQSSNTVALAIA